VRSRLAVNAHSSAHIRGNERFRIAPGREPGLLKFYFSENLSPVVNVTTRSC